MKNTKAQKTITEIFFVFFHSFRFSNLKLKFFWSKIYATVQLQRVFFEVEFNGGNFTVNYREWYAISTLYMLFLNKAFDGNFLTLRSYTFWFFRNFSF